MMMPRLVTILVFLLYAVPGMAHEVRPGYLEITETTPERYAILWKVPMKGDAVLSMSPILPQACSEQIPPSKRTVAGAMVKQWTVVCPGGLTGGMISIDGLQNTLTDALVRVKHSGGTIQTVRLTPREIGFTVSGEPSTLEVITTYLSLGVEHILQGVDHLLFVLGLLLIVGSRGMLLKTITAFTIAHSITLGIATLGYASAPGPPLNAAIALSILFLGPEIVRVWRGQTSFTIRHPWVVAFAFGLLHGFGFASGLSTAGLPSAEIPVALLLFNVGVEIGQLFFVSVILLLERSFHILKIRWPRWVEAIPAYTVGGLGAFWTIQRITIMLGGFVK